MFIVKKSILVGIVLIGIGSSPAVTQRASRPAANGLLPPVPIPADNPQTEAKIALGKQLFFDPRLSIDNSISCASCHAPEMGWADNIPFSDGVNKAFGNRNAPTVLNSAYLPFQFWDGRAKTLEEQALAPIQNPVEMNMPMSVALDRMKSVPGYVEQFKAVFGTGPTPASIAKAMAAFERTVVSTDSAYDKSLRGEAKAMSPAAERGETLFTGKGRCGSCHSGPNFTDGRFHNSGVGFKAGAFADDGRFGVTKNPQDRGAFKTPGLRSVAQTPPYFHDGSVASLAEAIAFVDAGGTPNPNLDPMFGPRRLTAAERADLLEFLKALTGAPLAVKAPALPK
jgi:cytochrome c peroxidase